MMRGLNICLTAIGLLLLLSATSRAETVCFRCHKEADFRKRIVHRPLTTSTSRAWASTSNSAWAGFDAA